MAEAAGSLNMAPALLLPADVVTQTLAILAERRAGKSSTGVRLAEQMFLLGLPWVAIDPKGDWWGMRAPGTGPGLKIPVFGGLRGDLPLTPESGRLIAELIVEQNLTCILDVSDFPSDAAQTRFLTEFARHLFALHRKNPSPRHLFLEEADEYIPQVVRSEQARCVHAWARIVKQGGAFGLGMTLLSQRSAVVNKNVLSQMSTLIAMRTTSSLDRAAVKDWIDYHAGSREIIDTLPALADGEGWVVSPHWLARHGQLAIQRVQFSPRTTFDSGATPTMASGTRPAATLADIDLRALAGRMAAVAEQAAHDDPAVLRRRIADLERQLRERKKNAIADDADLLRRQVAELAVELEKAQSRPPERVEVPVLTGEDRAAVDRLAQVLARVCEPERLTIADPVPELMARLQSAASPTSPTSPGPAAGDGDGDGGKLGKAERTVLAVLAQFPEGRTRQQLAVLSGYSPTSLRNPLGRLRTLGLAGKGDPIMITGAGRDAIGDSYEPLPAGRALVSHWMSVLGKAERTVLAILLDAWPDPVSRPELASRSGYSETSLRNPLGRLRTLELVHDWTADDTLAQAAREDVHS